MRNISLCLILIGLCAAHRAAAQCEQAPAAFATACSEMQANLSAYDTTLMSEWHGAKSPVAFGTELLSSNDNLGLKGILAPNAMAKVNFELDGLAKLGVTFVVTAVSFPILYQPFYAYNNDPQDYNNVLTFYQNVMAAARARGMKVLIESTVVFPNIATDLPLKDYYATLSIPELDAGRAQVAQVVAQQLQPDWLNLGSEPDTISELVGLPAEFTPAQWATDISTIVSQLRAAGVNGKPLIGAGCGTWQIDAAAYIQALMPTGIDYFDTHIFTVNMNELSVLQTNLTMVTAAGKPSAISECWDHKVTDAQLEGQSEYGIINAISAAEPYNDYSFGDTQDAEFLNEIMEIAYLNKLLYVAPFESELFFSYVNYTSASSLTTTGLQDAETSAEGTAVSGGIMSSTGHWFVAAIKPVTATTLSAASGASPVAPSSIVSIYGTNLASSSAPAPSLPLPTSLAGTSATLTDANNVQTGVPLFYASPDQINAQIPAAAAEGPAVLTINAPTGAVSSPVVITTVAPSLFTANESGQGVASAQFVVNENGVQKLIDIYNSPCAAGSCAGVDLDVSSGQAALVLFGTGIQNRASLSDVTVTVGTQTLPAFYAGPVSGYIGLDQVNVYLPASLAGAGTVNITVSIAGSVSNTVTATFK